ncbi:hypothetical protein ACWCQN_47115, partial [Streptomyces sp. NPDC001984]
TTAQLKRVLGRTCHNSILSNDRVPTEPGTVQTLLEIFTAPGLDRRNEDALLQGAHGAQERLAEARLELGISPYSARTLITNIRKAWSLNDSPSIGVIGAAQRRPSCHLHGSRPDAFGLRRSS